MAGKEIIEQRRASATYVEISRGAWSKPRANLRHSVTLTGSEKGVNCTD
jgi:hypothetical protein